MKFCLTRATGQSFDVGGCIGPNSSHSSQVGVGSGVGHFMQEKMVLLQRSLPSSLMVPEIIKWVWKQFKFQHTRKDGYENKVVSISLP